MPCRDDYPSEPSVTQSEYDSLRAQEKATQKRCDLATRVACTIEKLLSHDQFGMLTEEVQIWITQHRASDALAKKQEEDRQRREHEEQLRLAVLEKARVAALKKLTWEERNVLGLPHPFEGEIT